MKKFPREQCVNNLTLVATLLNSGAKDYLTIYAAWENAREAMDGFLDNPDWLQEWVNDRGGEDTYHTEGTGEVEKAAAPATVADRSE